MKRIVFILMVSLIYCNVIGQQFIDFYGDYLGQKPPTDTPVVFLPDVVSTKNLEHSAAQFTNNGKEVYWISGENLNSEKYIQRLWFMKQINNRWTKPETVSLFHDTVSIGSISLLGNDQIYFGARLDKTPNPGIKKEDWMKYYNHDIWYASKQGHTWNEPTNIGSIINTNYLQSGPSITKEGTIYFLSYLDGVKSNCGIFKSVKKDGKYTSPEALPICINSKESQDWTPFIANDDSYLIFSSYREGQMGNGDLYISFHNMEEDKWSEAINMGSPINTRRQERFPYVSPDGKYLFFTRPRKGYSQDIWWVKADIIKKLKVLAEY